MNLWGVVAQTVVSVVLAAYVRRQLRLNRSQLEPLVLLLDVGSNERKGARVKLRQYRKGIAAGAGSLLGGLLVYVEANDLDPILGPLVAPQWRPLLGWGLGAIAVVVGVVNARNDPKPELELEASDESPTLDEPAPPATDPVDDSLPSVAGSEGTAPPAAAAIAPAPVAVTTAAAAPDPGPFWAGVQGGAPTSPTSLVKLQDVPIASPL